MVQTRSAPSDEYPLQVAAKATVTLAKESATVGPMRSGIVREDEGFHVMVDGVDRVFSLDEPGAYEHARELKRRNRNRIIEIRDRSNGKKVIMLEDGRTA